MRIFIDTNVLLYYLLKREGLSSTAVELFTIAISRKDELLVADLSIANIKYITRKVLDNETFYQLIKDLKDIVSIIEIGEDAVYEAVDLKWKDFEEALQYAAARAAKADFIVSRNAKDFVEPKIPVLTPIEFLQQLHR